jgi:Ca-activated chloride channel homolog
MFRSPSLFASLSFGPAPHPIAIPNAGGLNFAASLFWRRFPMLRVCWVCPFSRARRHPKRRQPATCDDRTACHDRGQRLAARWTLMKPLASFTLALLTAVGVGQSQQPTFRSGARTVAVYATVAQKDGRLITDLTRDAFEIRDEGKPQPISVFSTEVQPISVVIMLDRSGSMRGNVGLVEQAAETFVNNLGPGDAARIGTFAERIVIRPETFTNDRGTLLGILRSGQPVIGPTPLWNAIDQAIEALREREGRKVVLVFSDGGDAPMNLSLNNRSIMDVMRDAQRDDVMVYAIGLQTTVLMGPNPRGGMGSMSGSMTSVRPDPGLARIAEDSGGGYFELTRAENLATTFAAVADELHHQYALGFEPPKLDDRMHKLDVRVNRHGLNVRARKEYFAARPSSTQ